MQVISVISTNGDVGKTAVAANPRSFVADARLRVLPLNLDMQPTLSSYYERISHAPSGIDERLAFNMQDLRTVLLELELLTWQQAISPVTPETLAAQELSLGPVQLVADIAPYRNLGMTPSPLHLLINRVLAVSSNAHMIPKTLRLILQEQADIHILDAGISAIEVFPRAATLCLPAHRVDAYQTRFTREIMCRLATELFPQWHEPFIQVTGKTSGGPVYVKCQ